MNVETMARKAGFEFDPEVGWFVGNYDGYDCEQEIRMLIGLAQEDFRSRVIWALDEAYAGKFDAAPMLKRVFEVVKKA